MTVSAITRFLKNVAGGTINPATEDKQDSLIAAMGVFSTIGDGRKVIAATGTAEALAGSTSCLKIDITAGTGNTSAVVVGGSTVVAAIGTRRGNPLDPGDTITLNIDDLAKVFVDVITSGDEVTFTYYA